jgi:predicted DNA-binding transcriptional regulator YafY
VTLGVRRAHKNAVQELRAEAYRRLGAIPERNETIVAAIRERAVLKFTYNRKERLVEPQTYGLSIAGREVLRGYQRAGGSHSGEASMAKLFDVQKMSKLKMTGEKFAGALPQHNPQDSAMIDVFETLPLPKPKR